MPRTKAKKVDAILTADWHLREDTPVCRTDDYMKAQATALLEIRRLQALYHCPVLVAGDIYHHWKPSPFLLSWTMDWLPDNIQCIPGNHDLPQHNPELFYKCGLEVLLQAEKIKVLSTDMKGHLQLTDRDPDLTIMMLHQMTWTTKVPWKGCQADSAHKVLKDHPKFDLILTGDNHKPFVVEHKGRLLVNPGSLMRMTADQIDHKPRVYLWHAESNEVTPEFLPIAGGVISREHIKRVEERDERMEAFVSKLGEQSEIGLSFEDNLKRFLDENNVNEITEKIIWGAVA